QASKRLAVDACKKTPVAKFVLPACEIAPQDLAFCLELSERDFDLAQRHPKAARQLRSRKRADRIPPSPQNPQPAAGPVQPFSRYPITAMFKRPARPFE